jgi:hypothetical protein
LSLNSKHMIERKTITFSKEEIILALQEYYNTQSGSNDDDASEITFYANQIIMDTSRYTIELEINDYND